MNHTTVINKISELGYKGFKEAYLRQMEDVNYHNLSFEDRVYQLLDAQDTFLNNRRTQMNLKLSKIKNKQALIENIDYDPKREINKAQILSLASMDFIRAHQNIIINGRAGTGKRRAATLLEDIKFARIDGSYTNLVKRFARYKLLILDDFGVSAISADDATNLFEIIEARNQLSSTIITSQLPVKDWYDYLQNNTIADAILDRIVNSSHRINLKGDSLRPKYEKVNENYE